MSRDPENVAALLSSLRSKDADASYGALRKILETPAPAAEHSLAFHLWALLAYRQGHVQIGADTLERASHLERDAGYPESAGHTLHAVALFGNVNGDVDKVRSYYRQSLDQLKKMKNFAGMGLCLRSLGEMALAAGLVDQSRTILSRSAQCLSKARPAEAPLVEIWLSLLPDPCKTDRTDR